MKNTSFLGFCLAGALFALGLATASAQVVEFRATIDAAQETPASASVATGWAVMLYDVSTNTYDLTVQIDNFANMVSASHIHEGAVGVAGGVVSGLGGEAVYVRNGTTLTATFSGLAYGGSPLTLLSNGAYINLHSATYPAGEVRGQLIAQPVKLVALLDGSQEVPATTSSAYGAALITYDPGTNMITTRLHVYNFTNTFANSHYHEAAAGASGGVVHGLGGASVYTRTGDSYAAVFENQTYLGDPLKLLTEGAYLNVHSNVNPPGEIRGQVKISTRSDVTRLVNVSSRGSVGVGEQVLITGLVISGTEPLRVLLTARGPSLAAFGVQNALTNPVLSLHDRTSRQIVSNDEHAGAFAATEIAGTGFAPANTSEAALLVVLPPGVYTMVVSGADGATGVALNEAYEVQP